jgi:hypothetical protein
MRASMTILTLRWISVTLARSCRNLLSRHAERECYVRENGLLSVHSTSRPALSLVAGRGRCVTAGHKRLTACCGAARGRARTTLSGPTSFRQQSPRLPAVSYPQGSSTSSAACRPDERHGQVLLPVQSICLRVCTADRAHVRTVLAAQQTRRPVTRCAGGSAGPDTRRQRPMGAGHGL